jgi:hypothetical protein
MPTNGIGVQIKKRFSNPTITLSLRAFDKHFNWQMPQQRRKSFRSSACIFFDEPSPPPHPREQVFFFLKPDTVSFCFGICQWKTFLGKSLFETNTYTYVKHGILLANFSDTDVIFKVWNLETVGFLDGSTEYEHTINNRLDAQQMSSLMFWLIEVIITFLRLKGTQDWEFFWLRFWNLRYFFVSYVKILKFYKKNFWIGPLLGEVRFFRVVLGLRGMKKNFELGKKNFFFFLQLWTQNMTKYSFFENSIN